MKNQSKIFCHLEMNITKNIFNLFFFFVLFTSVIFSQSTNNGKKISSNLFGLFFEDINYAADGGLYAELIQNRSFEYNPTEQKSWNPLSFWEYISPGFSYGRISVETNSPIHPNNLHYVVLDVEHVGHEANYIGDSGVGLKNSGFNGMVINAGEKYNLTFFVHQYSEQPINFKVSLQSPSGKKNMQKIRLQLLQEIGKCTQPVSLFQKIVIALL